MEQKGSWHDACVAPQQVPERQQPLPPIPFFQPTGPNDESAREAATITGDTHGSRSSSSNSRHRRRQTQPAETTILAMKRQWVFLFLIAMTQMIQIMPLGVGINSGLFIGDQLGATAVQSIWVVASFPMTQGTFVLVGGRLGAVYGHKRTLAYGCVWWTFWALAGGYAHNLVLVCVTRALCGAGGGIMVPNTIALIGIHLPPGPRRNIGFALFGAMAPVGAAGGSLVGAIVVQLAGWPWAFFLQGFLGLLVYSATLAFLADDQPLDQEGQVDWVGAYLGVAGLVLFNFVWNQAPSVGWKTPYEVALLLTSVAHFVAFCYWELRVASDPILPFDIWRGAPSFGLLLVAILFAFMGLGIFFWYMNSYMALVRGDGLITVGLQYMPLTIVGAAVPFLAAWLVPRVPAKAIIGVGCVCMGAINILLATIPANVSYWAMAFPALFLSAFTIDLITTSAQIIANDAVPRRHQGVAGSLIGTFLSYGQSLGLGFAGVLEVHVSNHGRDLLGGYHAAAYLAVGLSGAALLICAFIPSNRQT